MYNINGFRITFYIHSDAIEFCIEQLILIKLSTISLFKNINQDGFYNEKTAHPRNNDTLCFVKYE